MILDEKAIEIKKNNYVKISHENPKKNYFNFNIYRIFIIYFIINLSINFYLIHENANNKQIIKKLFLFYNDFKYIKDKTNKALINDDSLINKNKDLIGLKYPEISFNQLKNTLKTNIFSCLYQLLEKLEAKLIYLEKEINVTKLSAFYTARKLYLKKKNIEYDDSNITELHNIVSWLVIHKSTQLKGIASDKYLACEYVKMKLGINLCQHRIGVYNHYEDINYEEIISIGNVVLKTSNGCHDNIYIFNNTNYNIEKIKQKIKNSFYKDYSLIIPEFFHLYSKKRIVLEKMFLPFSDLYEFKIIIVNHNIIVIYVRVFYNNNLYFFYYDSNFNPIINEKKNFFDISYFDKLILDKLKKYAIKLSEDFPNYIRVDLYLFHNEIYLSELTFDTKDGFPFLRQHEIIKNAAKDWKRIDY